MKRSGLKRSSRPMKRSPIKRTPLKKKAAKKKLPTVASEKKKTWTAFSRFIRLRDCLRTTGTIYEGLCVTCLRRFHFKKLQAGHFVPSRCNSILFHEKNCHAQCCGCNVYQHGNLIPYGIWMAETYGNDLVLDLLRLKHEDRKFRRQELEDMRADYEQRYKDMGGE